MYAVHVLPLGEQLVRVLGQILGREEVDGALDVDDYENWKWVDEQDCAYFVGDDVLGLQESLLEVPQLAHVCLAVGGDAELG